MAGIQEYLESQVKNIQQDIATVNGQEAEELMKVEWQVLQNAARNFLEATYGMEVVNKLKQKKATSLLAAKDLPNEYKIKDFTQEFIKEKEAARIFYKNLFAFDEALSRYFNELPKRGVIVMVDAKGRPLTYEMSLEQMALIAEREGRIQTYAPGEQHSIENQIDQDLAGDMDHIKHGRAAFMGVNARLEAFYSKRAKKITVDNNGNQIEHEYQRQGGLLMWKNNGEWEVAVVANQGVISEAYVNFLFTRHDTAKDFLSGLEIGNPKYYSHNLIESFYKNYMSGVTNLAAIVEEDVIGEYAQYAVKAKKAALATPAQHLRVASTIVSSTSNISPKDLKKMIIDAFKKNSELAPLIKGTIKNSLTGEIKSIDKLGKIQKKMGSKGWISIDSSFDDFIKVIQDLIESEL